MSTNDRVYYAIHALGFAKHGVDFQTTPTGYIAVHGLQSVGHSVNFSIDTINEIGQLESYENVENIPDVQLTAEKVIDGYYLIQHLASQVPTSTSLTRYNGARCNIIAAIYDQSLSAASGVKPLSITMVSGAYISAIGFNIPVNGAATESVTFVANNRVSYTGVSTIPTGLFKVNSRFNNADSPPGTGGVQRRENVDMLYSRWPTTLPGISTSGTNNYINGAYQAHIQNVSVNVSLGRTELFELGRRGPYYRFQEFPTRVTCSIEITTNEFGDTVDAYEEQDNLTDESIKIVLTCGVTIDLGNKNKLESVTENGGDASGGNKTSTFNFFNFNSLTVTFPNMDFT